MITYLRSASLFFALFLYSPYAILAQAKPTKEQLLFQAMEDLLADHLIGGKPAHKVEEVHELAFSRAEGRFTHTELIDTFNTIGGDVIDNLAKFHISLIYTDGVADRYGVSKQAVERMLFFFNMWEKQSEDQLSETSGEGLRIASELYWERSPDKRENRELQQYFRQNITQKTVTEMREEKNFRSEAEVYLKAWLLNVGFVETWGDILVQARTRLQGREGADAERIIRDISTAHHVSEQALRNILSHTGVYPKRTDITDAEIQEIINLRNNGHTTVEIAQALGFTEAKINSELRKLFDRGVLDKKLDHESDLPSNLSLEDMKDPPRFAPSRFAEIRKEGEWDQEKLRDFLLFFAEESIDWQTEQLHCGASTLKKWRERFRIFDVQARKHKTPAEKLQRSTEAKSLKEVLDQRKEDLKTAFKGAAKNKGQRQVLIVNAFALLLEESKREKGENFEIPGIKDIALFFDVVNAVIATQRTGAFDSSTDFYIASSRKADFFLLDAPTHIDSDEAKTLLAKQRPEYRIRILNKLKTLLKSENVTPQPLGSGSISQLLAINPAKLYGADLYGPGNKLGHLRVFDGPQEAAKAIINIYDEVSQEALVATDVGLITRLIRFSPARVSNMVIDKEDLLRALKAERQLILSYIIHTDVPLKIGEICRELGTSEARLKGTGAKYGPSGFLSDNGVFQNDLYEQLLDQSEKLKKTESVSPSQLARLEKVSDFAAKGIQRLGARKSTPIEETEDQQLPLRKAFSEDKNKENRRTVVRQTFQLLMQTQKEKNLDEVVSVSMLADFLGVSEGSIIREGGLYDSVEALYLDLIEYEFFFFDDLTRGHSDAFTRRLDDQRERLAGRLLNRLKQKIMESTDPLPILSAAGAAGLTGVNIAKLNGNGIYANEGPSHTRRIFDTPSAAESAIAKLFMECAEQAIAEKNGELILRLIKASPARNSKYETRAAGFDQALATERRLINAYLIFNNVDLSLASISKIFDSNKLRILGNSSLYRAGGQRFGRSIYREDFPAQLQKAALEELAKNPGDHNLNARVQQILDFSKKHCEILKDEIDKPTSNSSE